MAFSILALLAVVGAAKAGDTAFACGDGSGPGLARSPHLGRTRGVRADPARCSVRSCSDAAPPAISATRLPPPACRAAKASGASATCWSWSASKDRSGIVKILRNMVRNAADSLIDQGSAATILT
jgi:hypothetical protein